MSRHQNPSNKPLIPDLKFRGANLEALYSHQHELMLSSGADCIHGETRIYDPITGQSPTIKWLCDNRISPHVVTLDGPEKALVPFKKGFARLYRVTLRDGRSFKATAQHFVLTSSRGFQPVSALNIGESLPSCERGLQESSSGICPLTSLVDVRHCFCRDEDLKCRCSPDCRLRLYTAHGQDVFPSHNYVPIHKFHVHHGHGVQNDLVCKSEYNRLFRQTDLLAILDSAHHVELSATSEQCYCPAKNDLAGFRAYGPRPEQFDFSRHLAESCVESTFYPAQKNEYEWFPSQNSERLLIRSQTIKSIEPAGEDFFYDITVPNAAHYFAEGAFHHNTGKTTALTAKHIILASGIPNLHGALVRKTFNSLKDSVCKTYKRLLAGLGVQTYGGHNVQSYLFPNGSEIVLVGLDKPERLLSSEWDTIQVCQSEELSENDWEIAASRVTGRGAVVPHPQIFGDCNPSRRNHWIRSRKSLSMLVGKIQDNPELYDDNGNITAEGERRVARLASTLSGVRKLRLVDGIWATAEGAVYDMFNPEIHVCVKSRVEYSKRWFLALDDGYTNPAVILDIGEDSDGRWHVFQEFYERGQMRETIVKKCVTWNKEFIRSRVAVDEAVPELVAQLKAAGLPAEGGKGKVLDGIRKLQDRFKVAGDNRPRLTFDPSCTNTINDFESYEWKPEKDEPKKENDHGPDAARYLEDILSGPQIAITDASQIETGTTKGVTNMPCFMPRTYNSNPAMPKVRPETPEEQKARIDEEMKRRFG